MDFLIATWRRVRPWISAMAVCAMIMYGYYLAGDREPDAIARGTWGTALVGVPSLAVLWILDRSVQAIETRRKARRDT